MSQGDQRVVARYGRQGGSEVLSLGWLVKMAAPLNATLREMVEMHYSGVRLYACATINWLIFRARNRITRSIARFIRRRKALLSARRR